MHTAADWGPVCHLGTGRHWPDTFGQLLDERQEPFQQRSGGRIRRSRSTPVPHRALLWTVALIAAPASAQDSTRRPLHYWTTYEDLQLFSQVLNELHNNHADSLDSHVLSVMAAIEGMLHAADPHSFVIPVIKLSASKAEAYRMGQLVPVPVSFAQLNNAFVVTGAADGSAAARAGILAGDRLVAADSVPVAATSVEELEISLAGPPHSEAVLTFERRRLDGSTVTLTRRVARAMPGAESAVPVAVMLDRRTGYLRIESFLSSKAGDDVHVALSHLHDQGMQRLVLDLRDNGGGIIEQAARVAGEFLPAGELIYTSEGRKKDATDTVRVKRSFFHHEERYPVVVLINGGTASAAELVAGALQDHDRAIIVGRPSFGKALMMKPIRLTDEHGADARGRPRPHAVRSGDPTELPRARPQRLLQPGKLGSRYDRATLLPDQCWTHGLRRWRHLP